MSEKNIFKRAFGHARLHKEYTLVCCVFLLCLLVGAADTFWLHRSDEFLGGLIFEIVIFLVPLGIYLVISGKGDSRDGLAREMNIRKISPRLIFLPVISALLIISGALILDMLFFGIYDITDGFVLYGIIEANGDGSALSNVYMILAFAIIPAIFEEAVFRKILVGTHKRSGIFISVFTSALFYSLTPMSPRLIPSFFFSGVIYCIIFIFTGSLVTSMAAHALANLYGIYLRTNVANYFVSSTDAYVLVVSAIIVFLICAIAFCAVLYRLFIGYAKADKTPPSLPEKSGLRGEVAKIFSTFKNPVNIVTLVIYITFVVIFGFFA